LKDVVHETLEGGRCITKAKGHHQELIMAFMSEKTLFWDIGLLHANLVIVGTKIKFGKELGTLEIIQEIIIDLNGELILEWLFFNSSKVGTHVPSAFVF
jgi:hypothetical protein